MKKYDFFIREKDPFFLIPLPLLRNLVLEHNTFYEMFHIGIYSSAMCININEQMMFKEFCYCIYSDIKSIPAPLYKEYETMKDFPYETKYQAYNITGKFSPVQAVDYLIDYSEKHPNFIRELKKWYRVRQMYDLADFRKTTVLRTLSEVERITNVYELDEFTEPIYILINVKVMRNLFTSRSRLSADDRAMWAMYLGIISIIGKKDYVQTTSDLIKCRMFGARNKEDLLSIFDRHPMVKQVYDKFTTKYQYNKLLNRIQDKNMIREIAFKRRTYLSYRAENVYELADMIMKKDNISIKKQRDEDKKKVIAAYYNRIKQSQEPKSPSTNLSFVSTAKNVSPVQHSSSDWDDLPF